MVLALEHYGRVGGVHHEGGAPQMVRHDTELAIARGLVSPAHAHQLAPEGVVADVGWGGLVGDPLLVDASDVQRAHRDRGCPASTTGGAIVTGCRRGHALDDASAVGIVHEVGGVRARYDLRDAALGVERACLDDCGELESGSGWADTQVQMDMNEAKSSVRLAGSAQGLTVC